MILTLETHNAHERAVRLLETQLKKGVLPHSHLFVGPRGVGRLDVARALAMAMFCSKNATSACSDCHSCRGFQMGEHPDYIEIGVPEGRQSLPIESVRELQLTASRKPIMGSMRVFVINDAELMSTEAANCFLKTLEEPPGDCYLILIATGLHYLPETIASRCQITKLTGLHPDNVKRGLCDDGIEAVDAGWLAMRSWGSPERAEEFYHQNLHEFNNILVKKTLSMRLEDNFEMSDFIQDTAKKLGSNSAEQRLAVQELLECLAMVYRDIAALIREPDVELFNEQCRTELTEYAGACDLDAAIECADRTLLALQRIGANVNQKIILDDLFSALPAIAAG